MLSSEVKGDLLVLFHKNPGLIDSIDGVARRIGRIGKGIDADVRDLVKIGVIGTRQVGGREIIFLDRSKDKAAQQSIVDYLKNLKPKTE
jgi:predicted transcriptional regulator